MAMLVVLVPLTGGEPSLAPESLRRLSELGVTDVSLVRDETTAGVVLEGWTFDPVRSGAAAARAVTGRSDGRLLMPVMEAAVVRVEPPERLPST